MVSKIWRWALAGWTLRQNCQELDTRGILTPLGKRHWDPSTIRAILQNRVYAGVLEALKYEAVAPTKRRTGTYGKSATRVRPQHERVRLEGLVLMPVVTETEFDVVQERLRENQRMAARRSRNHRYLLRGRIRCGNCGRVYVGVHLHGHTYYYCGGRWGHSWAEDKCPGRASRLTRSKRRCTPWSQIS